MISIPIIGAIYTVSFDDLDGNFGECDASKLTIKLEESLRLDPDHLWRVLCHEIGHAYLNESGMSDYMNDREQEMAAQTLGNFICALFPEPRWFKELLGE